MWRPVRRFRGEERPKLGGFGDVGCAGGLRGRLEGAARVGFAWLVLCGVQEHREALRRGAVVAFLVPRDAVEHAC